MGSRLIRPPIYATDRDLVESVHPDPNMEPDLVDPSVRNRYEPWRDWIHGTNPSQLTSPSAGGRTQEEGMVPLKSRTPATRNTPRPGSRLPPPPWTVYTIHENVVFCNSIILRRLPKLYALLLLSPILCQFSFKYCLCLILIKNCSVYYGRRNFAVPFQVELLCCRAATFSGVRYPTWKFKF